MWQGSLEHHDYSFVVYSMVVRMAYWAVIAAGEREKVFAGSMSGRIQDFRRMVEAQDSAQMREFVIKKVDED